MQSDRIVRGEDEIVAQWVETRLGHGIQHPRTAIGHVGEDGSLIGGTVFNNYYPEAGVVEMHSAGISPRWLSRPMIEAIFGYAFKTLRCQLVVLRVSPNNVRMCKIAEQFGFVGHRIPRLRGRGEDEMVYTLTDDDWSAHRFRRH